MPASAGAVKTTCRKPSARAFSAMRSWGTKRAAAAPPPRSVKEGDQVAQALAARNRDRVEPTRRPVARLQGAGAAGGASGGSRRCTRPRPRAGAGVGQEFAAAVAAKDGDPAAGKRGRPGVRAERALGIEAFGRRDASRRCPGPGRAPYLWPMAAGLSLGAMRCRRRRWLGAGCDRG